MIENKFSGPEFNSADDLMRAAIEALLKSQERFFASRGDGREILGANLRLVNPRARLSRSEMRGKVYSALGELFWCLSGSDELGFILHYLKNYSENSDDGRTVHGAYGPRIFGEGDRDQVRNLVSLLRRKPGSRRAVIQIFSASDLKPNGEKKDYKDIPCTCSLQVILHENRLNLIAHMRSNDAYLGLPHDIFVFTMLQELIARALGVELGFYQHMVGHLHLYEKDRSLAGAYMEEGHQCAQPMDPMPAGNPFDLLPDLVRAEKVIREDPGSAPVAGFPVYWEDILRLLRIYSEKRHKLDGFQGRVAAIKDQLESPDYKLYVQIGGGGEDENAR